MDAFKAVRNDGKKEQRTKNCTLQTILMSSYLHGVTGSRYMLVHGAPAYGYGSTPKNFGVSRNIWGNQYNQTDLCWRQQLYVTGGARRAALVKCNSFQRPIFTD